MAPGGTLSVIEAVMSAGNESFMQKLMDGNMLVMTVGRERTDPEYGSLFEAGGFRLNRVAVTPMEIAVLEGSPI